MNSLRFENRVPVVSSDPNRTDIALFAGFVSRRKGTEIPFEVAGWLRERGWTGKPYGRESIDDLLQLPVPIDTWEVFDHLFEWERRPLDGDGRIATTYLGAAVRSFFAQGGRKCYVVRCGDPWLRAAVRSDRLGKMEQVVPGYFRRSFQGSPRDRGAWQGIAHLFGLPDVSFLCVPDLADMVGIEAPPVQLPAPLPQPPERFVECSEPEAAPPPDSFARRFSAPRCGPAEYEDWAWAVQLTADVVARHQREVQLVAAIPLPVPRSLAERDPLAGLVGTEAQPGPLALAPRTRPDRPSLASAFVQLAYPWVRTAGSRKLPERLESPDGVLTGLLARTALTRGAFRSAAGLHLADVYDVHPVLGRDQLLRPLSISTLGRPKEHSFVDRVSLFGPTPGGLALLSDVTASLSESYRPASVNRLVSIIVRTARRLGEDLVFEVSGDVLWGRLREALANLLAELLQAGALRGEVDEPFEVRCDRSTMSQSDIDSGRVIVEIGFEVAAPIESITVVLAMDEGGRVSLMAPRELAEAA